MRPDGQIENACVPCSLHNFQVQHHHRDGDLLFGVVKVTHFRYNDALYTYTSTNLRERQVREHLNLGH